MSDVFLKKIELSRTYRTNEHYFTLNCALIGAYKYVSFIWLIHMTHDYMGNHRMILAAAAFVFLFFYLKGIWLEDIKNSGIEVYELKLFLLIEIVNEEIFWFVSFCRILIGSFWWYDSLKHYIYLFKGSFWIIVGFAQVTIRIESWRIKSRIF